MNIKLLQTIGAHFIMRASASITFKLSLSTYNSHGRYVLYVLSELEQFRVYQCKDQFSQKCRISFFCGELFPCFVFIKF